MIDAVKCDEGFFEVELTDAMKKVNRYFKILQRGSHSWCDGYLAGIHSLVIFLKDLVEET